MSRSSNLSIWENNLDGMNWYDYVVGRKKPSEPFITPNTETGLEFVERSFGLGSGSPDELAYQDAWFNQLKAHDRKKNARSIIKHESALRDLENSVAVKLSKKTLPLNPYFEYMFADAALENSSSSSANSVEHLNFEELTEESSGYISDLDDIVDDVPSPPDSVPGTPAPEQPELQIIDLTSIEEDNLSKSDADSLDAKVLIDPFLDHQLQDGITQLIEDEQANVRFFGVSSASKIQDSMRTLSLIDCRSSPVIVQQILEYNFIACDNVTSKADIVEFGEDPSLHSSLAPGPEVFVRKRSAAALLDDQEDYNEEAEGACNKKIRLVLDTADDNEAMFEQIEPKTLDQHHSLVTSSRQTSGDFFNHRPLAVVPRGYAGQFDGMIVKPNFIADFKFNLTEFDILKSHVHYTFGDRLHPNGIYTHTNINVDPIATTPDYSKENLPDGHPLLTCMCFATDMTIAATNNNVVTLRNHDEEILRREAHIECAYARLEGVSVGYYRYYQGHLSIEEYHDAGMCVC